MTSFSFNKPAGACPTCTGLGVVADVVEENCFDQAKSLSQNGVLIWDPFNAERFLVTLQRAGQYYGFPFDMDQPIGELGEVQRDLQTLSLAEAGQLPLHRTRFTAADLLNDVAASFASRAAAQKVTLQAKCETEVELNTDYDRLDQVICNLVANALRYMPEGGSITLAARADAEQVIITVADNGAGIAAEDLPYIFDRFWKGDRARTRDGAGSGLGLAIARQLVRAHGGSIEAASLLGQGATFTISLPVD